MVTKKRSKSLSPPRKDPVMKRLADTLSRDELVGSLYSSTDERVLRLAEMMADPVYARFTLAKLCQRLGLSTLDLLELFRRYQLDMGIVSMSKKVVQIMEDTAEDARSRMETCKGCQGKGVIDTRRCPQCEGEGRVRVPGDDKARRLFFRLMFGG